jgi:hypothetical protein
MNRRNVQLVLLIALLAVEKINAKLALTAFISMEMAINASNVLILCFSVSPAMHQLTVQNVQRVMGSQIIGNVLCAEI